MKRRFEHPPELTTGRRYWRSLNELADKPEFRQWVEREFPAGDTLIADGQTRRHFLKIMGASMALAGLGMAGCRRPESYLVPYTSNPEWIIPGETMLYSTSMPRGNGAQPVLATCVDGRPIRLDGHRDSPSCGGGSDALLQASVLDLYDPERSRFYKRRTDTDEITVEPEEPQGGMTNLPRPKPWGEIVKIDEFYAELEKLKRFHSGNQGRGLAFLTVPSPSPTKQRLRENLQQAMPNAFWASYTPVSDAEATRAAEAVYGQPLQVLPDFAKADVIVSLESDFLGSEEGGPEASGGYARGRRRLDDGEGKMNRLYVLESRFSVTGGMADHRLRVRSSDVLLVANLLALEVGKAVKSAGGKLAALPDLEKYEGAADGKVAEWIAPMAKDLAAAGPGKTLIVAGRTQPAAVHAIVAVLNEALGNVGQTIRYTQPVTPPANSLTELIDKIDAGQVQTLFVMGGNPVFNAPADVPVADALKKVGKVIRVSLYEDETTECAHWQVPEAHWLESWSDGRAQNGTYLAQQPMILPLYAGLSQLDIIGMLLGMVQIPRPEGVPAPASPENASVSSAMENVLREEEGEAAPPAEAAANAEAAETETGTAQTPSGAAPAPDAAPAPAAPPDEELPEINSMFLVQDTFRKLAKVTGPLDLAWKKFLHDGFWEELTGPSFEVSAPALQPAAVKALVAAQPLATLPAGQFEVTFYSDGKSANGDMVNNGWLQELPDPMTKLTWDNALLVAPADIPKLGIGPGDNPVWEETYEYNPRTGEVDQKVSGVDVITLYRFPMVEVTVGGRKLACAVLEAPGQAEGSVALALGYGRRRVGHVGAGSGFNAYKLRTAASPGYTLGATIQRIAPTYHLAITQEHNSMEARAQVRESNLETYEQNPTFVRDMGIASHMVKKGVSPKKWGYNKKDPAASFQPFYNNPYYSKPKSEQNPLQWGMNIDLNLCTGCNSCVTACQAENNIPIVGKEQVLYSREMHWLRLDRYFAGDRDDPQMVVQPMSCQQCENAPCETVCPVNATIHNDEGLNVMAYNRCIGTRYCANNCPYKVRRFNYFDYQQRPIDQLYYGPLAKKGMAESKQMVQNPNVTVRMRGVMEKCTFCVQRIEEAKIAQLRKAKGSKPELPPDGAVRVACQDSCDTGAIAFGNIYDENSQVSKMNKSPRAYQVLDYLGVKPRITYLARVKNPNMAMPGADLVGNILPIAEHHDDHGHGKDHGYDKDHGAKKNGHGAAEHAPAETGGHH
ncbi:MAG: TAT-variant-translocated molybdopterin oxidoreductase [Verrucomicrobiota bacterium]